MPRLPLEVERWKLNVGSSVFSCFSAPPPRPLRLCSEHPSPSPTTTDFQTNPVAPQSSQSSEPEMGDLDRLSVSLASPTA
jgi:hypothetical protein